MKTLIELYDPSPFENILSTEVFRPERTVFLCPMEMKTDGRMERRIRGYCAHRGIKSELVFRPVSLLDASALIAAMEDVLATYPDCALDISGGSDAALFAGGMVCAHANIPVFTYSRKKGSFFDIRNASFADGLRCALQLSIEDCFVMAGASSAQGRVDNAVLEKYAFLIHDMFSLYLRHRRDWPRIVSYIQLISRPEKNKAPALRVSGAYTLKGNRGRKINAPEKALKDMQGIGLIDDLSIRAGESVSFTFRDMQIRTWLRDVGSMLELFTYQSCLETGLFQEVRTSVVVDWDGGQSGQVTNEIDVMATRGTAPLFVSCKTCAIKTEALNELAVLRDRFGSEMARAAIVTAERANSAVRQRAQRLNIHVFDIEDLRQNRLQDCLARACF